MSTIQRTLEQDDRASSPELRDEPQIQHPAPVDKETEGFDFETAIRESSGLEKELFTAARDAMAEKGVGKTRPEQLSLAGLTDEEDEEVEWMGTKPRAKVGIKRENP